MRKLKLFLINGIILTSTSFLLRIIGVSFNVYISNKIGSESVGIFQLLMSVYAFFITISISGINLACTRVISEELACGFTCNIKKASLKCLISSLCFGTFSGILLFFLTPYITSVCLHNKISSLPLYIISVSLPFVAMSSCMKGYFSAVRRVSKTAFVEVFEQIIKILLISYLINLFMPPSIDYTCISLVLGTTLSEFLSFLVLFITFRLDKKRYICFKKFKPFYTNRIFKISIPIAITSYIRAGLSTLKQMLIPYSLEKSGLSCEFSLSQYGMINGMIMPILMFPSTFLDSFCGLLIPEFSEYNIQNKRFQINFNIIKIFRYTINFSICVIGIFICFHKELCMYIYNSPDISIYLMILSPIAVFTYLDNAIDSMLKGLDKQVNSMIINILDLFTSISIIFFFLPLYGIYGYLFVIIFSEFFNFILSFLTLKKETKFKFSFLLILKPLFCLLLCFCFTYLISSFFTFSIFSLILKILLFIAIYLLLLYLIN